MKLPNKIIYIGAVVIGILCLVLRWPRVQKEHEINKLKLEKDNITAQIEVLSWELNKLSNTREYYCWEKSVLKMSWDVIRDEIGELKTTIKWIDLKLMDMLDLHWSPDNENIEVMKLVCEKAPKSPLCMDFQLLDSIKLIWFDKWVNYKLLLWMSYAESHLWMAFAPHFWCEKSNNWGGIKRKKNDDGTVSEKFNKQYTWLDPELRWYLSWCYLYAFETVEDYFISLANTITQGYWVCEEDPSCIVKSYVWKYSQNWVDNVSVFLK